MERKNATVFKNEGNAAFKKKDWNAAIAAYTKAIEIDPTWHVPFSNRSQSYFFLKNYEEAAKDGERCIKADPTYVKGFHRATNAYVRLSKWGEAMKILDLGYKNGHRANKDLMKLHEMIQPRFEAEKESQFRAMSSKDQFKAKGNKFFKTGSYPEALAMYARCLKMCKLPEDKALKISCHCNRAICYQQQSDFSLVIAECNEALELDPCNPKALMRRSSAFEGMEKYRLALQDVRKVLLKHPTMAVANKAQHRLSSAVRRLKAAKAGQY